MKSLSSLNPYLLKYKGLYLLGAFFVVSSNYFSVESFVYTSDAIDVFKQILENPNSKKSIDEQLKVLLIIAGKILLVSIIGGVLKVAMRQTLIVGSRKIEFDLKNDIYKQYQRLNVEFYKENKIGDLMVRISEDVSQVREYLGPGIMYGINLISLFAIVFYQMLQTDKSLTFYSLISLPFLSICIYYISVIINKKSRELQETTSSISSFVQDSFSGIRTIKSYHSGPIFMSNYQNLASVYKKKALSLASVQAFFLPLMVLVIGLSYIFIFYIGGVKYISGEITQLGTISTFFLLINVLIWPFTSLGWISSVVQRAEASQKRINEFLKVKPRVENPKTPIPSSGGKFEFKNVAYTYPATGIQALKDVSFTLEKGKTLAIMGKTGSGKSTLGMLFARLMDPTSGEILWGGVPLTQVNLDNLRDTMGFVPQDAFLFSETIQENIAFGNPKANENDIILAAKNADVHHNIITFTKGYQTLVGERGVTLSGGQKQRISIARALVKNPEILIFDDSLSAVDTQTETRIIENLKSQKKTKIIITHRISSAKDADLILVLDKGEIIESGNHEQLIQKNGAYRLIYNEQSQNS